MFKSIYILFKKKLEVLREYLTKNKKKKFIKKFQLQTEYPILFVSKKNKILYLYINYRKLNNIIIKNQYLLFNISELQN